ncbi:MAG: beta-lactamase family protein [Holosporales bacterium]|jgi:CubicO group peptidase (beta-lactamase class C family)|nr:beta-lactamase family protein [Holosporales bacterium]
MIRIVHYCLLCALFLINSVCFAIPHTSVKNILPQFKEYVKEARKAWNSPGVSIAIIENGEVYYVNDGVAVVNQNDQITEDSVFCIMSCTKVITVSILQRLVDEGKISLEDKVTDYIPWFRVFNEETTAKVKVKHLISHCIGIPAFSGDSFTHLDWSQAEVITALSAIPLKHPVGEKYGYQNNIVGIAGMLIEKVTGKPLETLMREHIFEPLSMSHSSIGPQKLGLWARGQRFFSGLFSSKAAASPPARVSGHSFVHGKIIAVSPTYQYTFCGTSGVNSCVSDYIKLLACFLNEGVIEFGPHKGERLFSERAWKVMSTEQTNIGHVREDNVQFPVARMKKKTFYYGNGMFGMDYGEHGKYVHLLSHMGAGTGWRSLWFAAPEQKLGIVVFCNHGSIVSNLLPESLVYQFLDLYYKFSNKDWSANILKRHRRGQTMSRSYDCYVLGPPPSASLMCGSYSSNTYGSARVKTSKNKILLIYDNRKIELRHIGGPIFQIDPYELSHNYTDDDLCTVSFRMDKSGAVTSLEISQLNEGSKAFQRVGP